MKKTISSHLLCTLLKTSKSNSSVPVQIKGTTFYVKYTRTVGNELNGMVYSCHPKVGLSYHGVRVSVNGEMPYGEFGGFDRLVKLGQDNKVEFRLGSGIRKQSPANYSPFRRLAQRVYSFLYAC